MTTITHLFIFSLSSIWAVSMYPVYNPNDVQDMISTYFGDSPTIDGWMVMDIIEMWWGYNRQYVGRISKCLIWHWLQPENACFIYHAICNLYFWWIGIFQMLLTNLETKGCTSKEGTGATMGIYTYVYI